MILRNGTTSVSKRSHTATGGVPRPPRVLAVASGGGHWVQLLRLRPAFEGCELVFATVNPAYRKDLETSDRLHIVHDATRWNRIALFRLAWGLLRILLRERPDVVVSTGAAPGFFAIRIARLLGARTIWIDSMANVEQMSMSGARIGRHADLWLTQWPHLAKPDGPHYLGAVL